MPQVSARAAALALLAVAAVAVAVSAAHSPLRVSAAADDDDALFAAFVAAHGRRYASAAERVHRRAVFGRNMRTARALQHADPSAEYGASPFADLTEEEFRAAYLMTPLDVADAKNTCLAHGVTAERVLRDPPASIDWRDKGAVTPVKNQGGCGSCWAFSTVGVIESQWFLAGNALTQLSEQSLVDCSHDCSYEGDPQELVCNSGCMGGWQWNAYLTIMNQGGIDSETSYPYKGVDGTCVTNPSNYAAHIKNYTCLGTDETDMAAYVASNGPVAVAMNAGWLQFYVGGISDPLFCNAKSLDHALLVVGYAVDGSRPYWIVKNSWGSGWGEKGYFKLARGKGKCGINNAVSSVIIH